MNKLLAIINSIRYIDAAVFLGAPIMGILLSLKEVGISFIRWDSMFLYIFATYLLAIHVFLVNDWFDFVRDRMDKNKDYINKNKTTSILLAFTSIITGLVSLLLLFFFAFNAFLIGIILLLLSLYYSSSWIWFYGKGSPGLSSMLHILGGTLSFLLGYVLYGTLQRLPIISGVAFGFFLMGGHIFQEIQDREGDVLNNIETTASLLGVKRSIAFGLLCLGIGHSIIYYLMSVNFMPRLLWLNLLILALVILITLITLRKGLNFINVRRFRNQYRIVYAVFGLMLIFEILNNLFI